MQFILISLPTIVEDPKEILRLNSFFENGLKTFHFRKPGISLDKTIMFLQNIPSQYHSNIVLHNHHTLASEFQLKGIHFTSKERFQYNAEQIRRLRAGHPALTFSTSFHDLKSLNEGEDYDYVFLSPVYNSISKHNYKSNLNMGEIEQVLKATKSFRPFKIIALGGVTIENIETLGTCGFDGVAVIGAVWQSKEPEASLKSFISHINQS